MSDFQALVVDDSAVHLKVLEHTLLRQFERVHLARNGREAMELFDREQPALVITDCVMPDVGGFKVAEEARLLSDVQGLPQAWSQRTERRHDFAPIHSGPSENPDVVADSLQVFHRHRLAGDQRGWQVRV